MKTWELSVAGRGGQGRVVSCNHSPVRFVIIERSQHSEECSQPDTPVKTTTRDTRHHTVPNTGNSLPHSSPCPGGLRAGGAWWSTEMSPASSLRWVRCEVRLMVGLIPVSGVCLVLIVLSEFWALTGLARTSGREEQVTDWSCRSDWSQQLVYCSHSITTQLKLMKISVIILLSPQPPPQPVLLTTSQSATRGRSAPWSHCWSGPCPCVPTAVEEGNEDKANNNCVTDPVICDGNWRVSSQSRVLL